MTPLEEVETALGKPLADMTRDEAISLLRKMLERMRVSVVRAEEMRQRRLNPRITPFHKTDAAE